jgi:zinc D-Ala-D-Ala dipeptidase
MKWLSQERVLFFSSVLSTFMSCFPLSDQMREKGFVYLHEIDPTIKVSVRYAGNDNFIGKPVAGYNKPVIILTKQAAHALQQVQQEVQKDGYCLVVYDAYRPQCAVDDFIRWGDDEQGSVEKELYYPHLSKKELFLKKYVSTKSGHSRGSTVDLTLIKADHEVHAIQPLQRELSDGRIITILDDGTVDMGSSFDLFDVVSHSDSTLVDASCQKMRCYLKTVMEKYGFKAAYGEWWHFTLKDEPFPAGNDEHYFNFLVA